MRVAAVLAALLFSSAVFAQEPSEIPPDVITLPDSATASWRAGIPSYGALVSAVGLAPCGSSPQIEADLEGVVYLPVPATGVDVEGTITFDPAIEDACFRAYAVGASGRLSGPSPNARRVLLRPMPVVFLE